MMLPTKPLHVVIGISGGVDSAVAAMLLQQQGYRVSGLFMKNWEEDDNEEVCGAAEDLKLATAVCQLIDIPLHTVNFASEYWERVFAYFLTEYRRGRTPNPDVLCNKEIKFKVFLDHGLSLGADAIATGHYARIRSEHGRYQLLKGVDGQKDQSYFLHTLGQHELAHSLFPLGDYEKMEVRRLARDAGLPNHDRKDSTGICFIGERRFKDFLGRYLPAQPGSIESTTGDQVGRHDGLMYYTIGQRHGLGIGGAGAAWYVIDKDLEQNRLIVAQSDAHPALYHHTLIATDAHWIGDPPTLPFRCQAKIRYRQADQGCSVTALAGGRLQVEFDTAQRAIAPGQSVVFYTDSTCLGGAVIDQAIDHNQASMPKIAETTPQ